MSTPVQLKAAAADSKVKVLHKYPPAIGPTKNLRHIN